MITILSVLKNTQHIFIRNDNVLFKYLYIFTHNSFFTFQNMFRVFAAPLFGRVALPALRPCTTSEIQNFYVEKNSVKKIFFLSSRDFHQTTTVFAKKKKKNKEKEKDEEADKETDKEIKSLKEINKRRTRRSKY